MTILLSNMHINTKTIVSDIIQRNVQLCCLTYRRPQVMLFAILAKYVVGTD